MKPHYYDPHVTVYNADVLAGLRALPDGSVHCCVTSPPYWGLRDYGTAEWEGGDAGCDHQKKNPETDQRTSTLGPGGDGLAVSNAAYQHGKVYRDTCGKCGATRKDHQLGLESTPEEYVARMVEVFREVRRVLRDDGTLWLNLGDSYAANGVSGLAIKGDTSTLVGTANAAHTAQKKVVPTGLKPKDLVGIPWRVAFALQADGWWLRSDIIWHKPNPMPESVTDRPTKAHEYMFLLTKSATYFYDADAIAEDAEKEAGGKPRQFGATNQVGTMRQDVGRTFLDNGTRNRRTVWTITTKPYPEAHFATFPPELPTLCIKAGCPEGGTVLDPFAGSGTTLWVAKEHGRKGVGIELNAEYCGLIARRCQQQVLDLGPAA